MLVKQKCFSIWQNNFTQDFKILLNLSIENLKINTKLKDNLIIIKLEFMYCCRETLSINIFKFLFGRIGSQTSIETH